MTTAPPVFDPPSERELDLRYYAGIVWRSRVFIVALGLVGLALGFVVALLQTPQYRAGAMTQIEPPTPSFMTVTDALAGMGNYWQNADFYRSEEHTSELQSHHDLVCRLLLEKKKKKKTKPLTTNQIIHQPNTP